MSTQRPKDATISISPTSGAEQTPPPTTSQKLREIFASATTGAGLFSTVFGFMNAAIISNVDTMLIPTRTGGIDIATKPAGAALMVLGLLCMKYADKVFGVHPDWAKRTTGTVTQASIFAGAGLLSFAAAFSQVAIIQNKGVHDMGPLPPASTIIAQHKFEGKCATSRPYWDNKTNTLILETDKNCKLVNEEIETLPRAEFLEAWQVKGGTSYMQKFSGICNPEEVRWEPTTNTLTLYSQNCKIGAPIAAHV